MKSHKFVAFCSIGVFLTCMAPLFLKGVSTLNETLIIISGAYALVCLGFLIFQLTAFLRAHAVYDQECENIKYQVFEAEGVTWKEN